MTSKNPGTEWLETAVNDAVRTAESLLPDQQINITITYAPVTNNDNRTVIINNDRSSLPRTNQHAQAPCSPSRQMLTRGGQYIPLDADTSLAEMRRNADDSAQFWSA